MNWHFSDDGTKPHDLQECIGIDSRKRIIVSCYWMEYEDLFRSYEGNDEYEEFYLGPFEDYDNYIVAWIPIDEVLKDYFSVKETVE